MINSMTAVQSLRPNAEAVFSGGTLTWMDTTQTQPTDAEITAEMSRLQAEYDANTYARSRKAEYDKLNQFELMTDDARDGTTTHAEAIEAIKAEFPKPV